MLELFKNRFNFIIYLLLISSIGYIYYLKLKIENINLLNDVYINQIQSDSINNLNNYNNNLLIISESNNQSHNQIKILEVKLNNELEKNIKLINDNNKLTKRFTMLYDASTSHSIPTTSNQESDATEASKVAPNRILYIMQQNNINHQKCIVDLNTWIDWYQMNKK